MKKIILFSLLFSILLIAGCANQPDVQPPVPSADQQTSEQPEQECTQRWICASDSIKAYRKSDCTFEQITNCSAGCENGNCKEVAQEPKEEIIAEPEETPKEVPKSPSKSCELGWICLDSKRIGYSSTSCITTQVTECKYGCKDNACIKIAPPAEVKEESFSVSQGIGKLTNLGSLYSDFSKGQIFLREVNDQDVKLILYASSMSRNYLRVESPISSLWIIDKEITNAARSDCIEKVNQANAYGSLKSGQTLCLETKEKNIALIGGYWVGLPKEDTELTWKYYIPK